MKQRLKQYATYAAAVILSPVAIAVLLIQHILAITAFAAIILGAAVSIPLMPITTFMAGATLAFNALLLVVLPITACVAHFTKDTNIVKSITHNEKAETASSLDGEKAATAQKIMGTTESTNNPSSEPTTKV